MLKRVALHVETRPAERHVEKVDVKTERQIEHADVETRSSKQHVENVDVETRPTEWQWQRLRSNYGYLKVEEWQRQCLKTKRRAFCIKSCCLFVHCGVIFSARHVVSLVQYVCLFFAKH